jgi:hypothetical protein
MKVIADFQVPIADFLIGVSSTKPEVFQIGNRQSPIGNRK